MDFMDLSMSLWNCYHTPSVHCHLTVCAQRGITSVEYFSVYILSLNKRTLEYSEVPIFLLC